MANRHFVLDGTETKYFIEDPTAEDVRGAEWEYSRVYTKCLMEGMATSSEMVDILTRRGIIGPEFEKRANELTEKLHEKIIMLENSDLSDEEKRDLAYETADLRVELFRWNQRFTSPMNNTAEQIADEAKLQYLTSCMLVNASGNRIWKDHNSYLNEKNRDLFESAKYHVMLYFQGLDSDFIDKTPEALVMKELETSMIKKAEEAIKAMEAVEEESSEEDSKKKSSDKKTKDKK